MGKTNFNKYPTPKESLFHIFFVDLLVLPKKSREVVVGDGNCKGSNPISRPVQTGISSTGSQGSRELSEYGRTFRRPSHKSKDTKGGHKHRC